MANRACIIDEERGKLVETNNHPARLVAPSCHWNVRGHLEEREDYDLGSRKMSGSTNTQEPHRSDYVSEVAGGFGLGL